MKVHRIDIDDLLDRNVYRIMPMYRFLEVLETGNITLVKPKLWKDPLETILFEYNTPDESIYDKENFFAQCWTLDYESEALWNIYAPQQDGIRVRTKLSSLIGSLERHNPLSKTDWMVVGKVDYKSIQSIKTWFKKNSEYHEFLQSYGVPYREAVSLLIKRSQYKHEKEIRIIYHGQTNPINPDLFNIESDPAQLFDLLMLDPRMAKNVFEIFRDHLSSLGFDKKKIIRSKLYDETFLKIKFKK